MTEIEKHEERESLGDVGVNRSPLARARTREAAVNCSATLRDDSACQSVAVVDGLCRPCAKKVQAAAELDQELDSPIVALTSEAESVAAVLPVGNTPATEFEGGVLAPAGAKPVDEAGDAEQTDGGVARKPANVRGQLAEDLTEDYELVRAALRSAVTATKSRYGTCRKCKSRVEVPVEDWAARTRAVELWIDQGLGKAATISQKAAGECKACASVEAFVGGMSEEDSDAYFLAEAIRRIEEVAPNAAGEAWKEVTAEIPRPNGGNHPLSCWKPYKAHIDAEIARRYPDLDRTPYRRRLLDDLRLEPEREARVLAQLDGGGTGRLVS